MKNIVLKIIVDTAASGAADLLAQKSGLPKMRIKDAMNKGAVWTRRKGKMQRLRKATARPHIGDVIELYYDGRLLAMSPPQAKLISDMTHYSIWYKPAGLMSQGTMFGDHCSLLRQAELQFRSLRPVFLVHRLDREADGIMLIAHSSQAAAKLSELFRKKEIEKEYRVEVLGRMGEAGENGTIDLMLDGKPAVTDYRVLSHDADHNISALSVFIRTGRLHQIRRHFEMIGHPVIGDPRYGKDNKNSSGMRLTAVSLRFRCPFSGKDVVFGHDAGTGLSA